ncbi:hypothetical protein BGZ99_003142 [Dissophora globulifera]|uniref:Uncharacterized protein n=1 Tax=Dissophora globulifera TaxID=979702 RepID=A0A9P6UWI9_9FUNG|nr:hypothetical protein BGZ99_003142 [Dissophora globulifera]
MPLLKRKAIKPVPPPNPADFDDNATVYMMRFTNEIFTTYEDYINRFFFYRQKTWQCETTGKSGLTYEQALESEHREKSMVANKLPPQLRKPLLEFVQFETTRIDGVVDDAITKFKNVYFLNEPVNVFWGKATYGAVIRRILPKDEWTTVENGTENPEEPGQYLVQVLDEEGEGIEDMERVVDCSLLSRDRLAFNKNILRKYIRECATKESYMGAPWIVKPSLAKKYGIDTKMPAELQAARESAFIKLKKRKGPGDPAPELAAAKKAKKEATDKSKEDKSGNDSTSTAAATASAETNTIKYPIEDLDLDPAKEKKIVKKDSEGNEIPRVEARPEAQKDEAVPQDSFEAVVMSWQFLNSYSTPLKLSPFGLHDFEDALTHTDEQHPSVMVAEYHSALMNVIIQDRLNGIAKPILLASASTAAASATASAGNSTAVSTPLRDEREGSVMTEDDESTMDDGDLSIAAQGLYVQRRKFPQRPINERVGVLGQGWDERMVPVMREGWEAVLLGSFDAIPNVDRILNHLVPNDTTQREDVEFLYPSLPYEDKISILVFLVETAAGTSTIRLYIEECRQELKALRAQKIDLNRERRQIQLEWAEFERQDSKSAAQEKAEQEQRSAAATPEPSSSHDVDSDAEADTPSSVNGHGSHKSNGHSTPLDGQLSRSESRQEKLKRQQQERELLETRRHQDLMRQRATTKARAMEQKVRHDARKRLMDKEHAVNKREEQVDRNMRRYAIARVKPLGKDRFFNRYWYFDGITMDHATDRVYVQSPSFLDLETVRARRDRERVMKRQRAEDPFGGLDELLKAQEMEIQQGLVVADKAAKEKKLQLEKERAALDTDTDTDTNDDDDGDNSEKKSKKAGLKLTNGSSSSSTDDKLVDETVPVEHMPAKWSYYSEPEQVDTLLQWLNSRGHRESELSEAINSHYDLIVGGMQRRHQDLLSQLQREQHRRSTRTKTVQATEGYLGYINRAASK